MPAPPVDPPPKLAKSYWIRLYVIAWVVVLIGIGIGIALDVSPGVAAVGGLAIGVALSIGASLTSRRDDQPGVDGDHRRLHGVFWVLCVAAAALVILGASARGGGPLGARALLAVGSAACVLGAVAVFLRRVK
jgi:hypothetical protein